MWSELIGRLTGKNLEEWLVLLGAQIPLGSMISN